MISLDLRFALISLSSGSSLALPSPVVGEDRPVGRRRPSPSPTHSSAQVGG